jgi:RHS repeat-associated protein
VTTPAVTVGYTVDGRGLRQSRTVGLASDDFVWSTVGGLPLLLEDGDRAYLYGPSITPIAQVDGGGVEYLHGDLLGSVRAITDDTGAVAGRSDFDAFGARTAHTGAGDSAFGFTGSWTDPDTGLVHLRARDYDPGTGQFLTYDPAVDATRQPYAYTGNNPLQRTDPSGLCPVRDGTQIADCTAEDFGGNSWFFSDFAKGIGAFLDYGLGEDAQNVIVGLGDAASFGLSEHIRNALSPGAECFVEKDGWYFTGGALGFVGSLLTGSAVLGAGMKLIQSARALFAAGKALTLANRASQLATAAAHLESIGAAGIPQNAAMLARIEQALASGRTLTIGETNFLLHETTEAAAVARGLAQEEAHALAGQTHPPFMNYDPAVIAEFPEMFNPNWLRAWGING